MAPMPEPPPSKAASPCPAPCTAATTSSIDSLLKELQKLILNFALPKTKNAKLAQFLSMPSRKLKL